MVAEILISDVVDYSKLIENHSFTIGWLLDSLRNYDKTFIKLYGNRGIKNVTAYDVTGGKGYLSVVLRCTLIFVDSIDSKDVYSTILKIPGTQSMDSANEKCGFDFGVVAENKSEVQNSRVREYHEFECEFYKNISPILKAPTPKVYKMVDWDYEKNIGCLHMEDLTLSGKTITFFENINLTQVKNMIRTLAHMNKNILVADPHIWQGKYLKNQQAMVNFPKACNSSLEKMLEKCKNQTGLDFLVKKYQNFYLNTDFSIYANSLAYKDLGLPSILVHGDMHSGNIMWAIDAEGNIQNELTALVDWQIMHEGSPMSDLARFLTHCCDGVVRRQSESFAIEYYFECLTKEFEGDKAKITFSIEQLKTAYNYSFIAQAFLAANMTESFYTAIEDKIPTESLKKAYYNYAVLKAIHMYEDIDRLLEGEMKKEFEKYGI